MSHTKGPWHVSEVSFDNDGIQESVIKGLDGRAAIAVTLDFGPNNPGMREANARRIVACVNALEGLNDDALSGGWSFRGIERYAKSLEMQRDELRAEFDEFQKLQDSRIAELERENNIQTGTIAALSVALEEKEDEADQLAAKLKEEIAISNVRGEKIESLLAELSAVSSDGIQIAARLKELEEQEPVGTVFIDGLWKSTFLHAAPKGTSGNACGDHADEIIEAAISAAEGAA